MTKSELRANRKVQLPLLEFAANAIRVRLKELVAYDATVRQADAVSELHEMRIAAKRLRYTLELFREVYAEFSNFGPLYDELTEAVKLLQDQLGGIHDADVLVPELNSRLRRLLLPGGSAADGTVIGAHQVDFDASAGVLTVCRQLQATRDRHYQQALVSWSRLKDGARLLELQDLLTAFAVEVNTRETSTERNIAGTTVVTEETGNGRNTNNSPTEAEGSTDSGRRARTRNGSGRTVHAKNGVRHSGARPDTRTRPDESGTQ